MAGVLALGATTLANESRAFAQSSTDEASKKAAAKAAYAEGQRAFDAKDYRHAGESFERAYRLSPHHAPLWNAAQSWIKAGEEVGGMNLLERYLAEAPADAPDRDRATALIRESASKLGRLDFVSNAASDVKVDRFPVTNDRHWVVPGEHVVTGMVNDKPVQKSVTVAAGQRLSVSLDAPVAPPPPPPPPTTPPPPSSGLPPWVFYTGVGATVVGGVVTGVTLASFIPKSNAWRADRGNLGKLAEALDARDGVNIAMFTTIGIATVTAVVGLLFTDWKGSKQPSTERAALGPRGPATMR